MRPLLLCYLVFYFLNANAQIELKIKPSFFGEGKSMNEEGLWVNKTNDLKISKLQFYISGLQFYQNEKLVYEEKDSYHLIDLFDESSQKITIDADPKINYTHLSFNLGIDSLTNQEGALGGDLDPTKGMYWTWQSGYINFKLEGNAKACPSRNNAFQFHLGGYQYPNNSLQRILLEVAPKDQIQVMFNLDPFFEKIDLSTQYQIMSPSQASVQLSQWLATAFSIYNE